MAVVWCREEILMCWEIRLIYQLQLQFPHQQQHSSRRAGDSVETRQGHHHSPGCSLSLAHQPNSEGDSDFLFQLGIFILNVTHAASRCAMDKHIMAYCLQKTDSQGVSCLQKKIHVEDLNMLYLVSI